MKVNLSVDVADTDAEFFANLINGNYAWSHSATLSLAGGDAPAQVDASWILRAEVSLIDAPAPSQKQD